MIITQNSPQLRFKEFDGKWKETLLNDVAEFRKGKGISKSDIIDDGDLECIRYGELYTTYNELIVNVVSKTNLPLKGLELSEYNDVIIPASGETQLDIATASCVLKSGVALSGDLNIIRSSLNGIFLSFYLNNKKKLEIAKLAQGSSVVHLYSSQLKSLKLNIPTLPEQQKIASFLTAVDEKIQQLSRKKELLSQYKKGVMQQLFSGKLRFKDEDGLDYADWEEKKLGDVLKIGSGKDYKHLEKGNIPVFGTGGYMLSVNKYLHSGETVFIGRKGTIDKPFYFNGEFWTVDTLFYTHTFKNVTPKFIYCVFQQVNWKLHNEASGVPSLSKSTIEKLKFDFPCLEEQQKIADFLSSIDTKIESTSQQINQMQSFKKGLLQQMFV